MAHTRPEAVVVGAGVNGLTCAVRLLEAGACSVSQLSSWSLAHPRVSPAAGWDVRIISRDRPEATVSLGAGAIWEFPPVRVSNPCRKTATV